MSRLLAVVAALLGLLAAAHAADKPVLFIEDTATLAALEQRGHAFADLFHVATRNGLEGLHDDTGAYRAIVDVIGADVEALRAEMKAGGRPLREFTAAETGRVMDMRWLTSSAAHFRLVGVVNRMDRKDFHDLRGEGGCGEVRFIYRLAYAFQKDGRGKILSSRMPFNFNAVFDVAPDADGGCVGVARRWTPAADERADIGWLTGGPLEPSQLKFRQLEMNAQLVRFPSGQEPQFGGQAVYVMRIFGLGGDTIAELPLENTPDTARIAADAALKARLLDYVKGNAAAIDQGVYQLPDDFLARKIVSYSTFGNARQVNHPFVPLLDEDDLAGLDLSAGKLVRSPAALIERLDNGACQGCHQAGATAGFHFIGLDDQNTSPLNRIEVGISPHFHAELPRREAWVTAVGDDRQPNRFRQLSFAPPAEWKDAVVTYESAAPTQACIARADAAGFGQNWQCGGGTVCTPLADADGTPLKLAQCLLPKNAPAMFSGHPCLAGPVTSNAEKPFDDDYATRQFTAFADKASPRDYTCRPPRIGVPGGIAYRQCDEKDRAFASFRPGQKIPMEVCGLTGGKKFDLCVATGNFDQCLSGAVQRGNRTACSADQFCRDDYICQAFPDDTPNVKKIKGVGFCSPTYFLFQMRIDNHTTPWELERDRDFLGEEPAYRSVEADVSGFEELQ